MRTGQRRAPLAVGWAVRRARELADPVIARLSRDGRGLSRDGPGRSRDGQGLSRDGRELSRDGRGSHPLPPRRLRARTGAPGAREFAAGGAETAAVLADAVSVAGRSCSELSSALDFGCGSGRVLPHFRGRAAGARCTGCDVDPAAIAWATRHLPELEWVLSGAEPPLPFASEQFDLIYSISVFSHLDEHLQDRWLAELRRVLVPGGTALLSIHGEHAFEAFRSGRVRTRWCPPGAFARGSLDDDELMFVPYRRSVWNRGELPGVADSYGLAFHGPGYVQHRWQRWLEVVEVQERLVTGWQDLVVCRRA